MTGLPGFRSLPKVMVMCGHYVSVMGGQAYMFSKKLMACVCLVLRVCTLSSLIQLSTTSLHV